LSDNFRIFAYDADGNMTSVGGQMTNWDAENRPISIQRVSGSELYTYDADGDGSTAPPASPHRVPGRHVAGGCGRRRECGQRRMWPVA